jgi:O-acetyl-ADP-ribose deacetylase
MQDALFQHLTERGTRHVNQGDLICMPPCGSPYRAVYHAVAVDGVYDSTPAIVSNLVAASLQRASEMSAQTVAMSALATGYGRKSIDFFARALTPVMAADISPVNTVMIGVRKHSDAEVMRTLLPDVESA